MKRTACAIVVAMVVYGCAVPAVDALELAEGEGWRLNLDTTLSLGVAQRVQGPDAGLIGKVTLDPRVPTLTNAAQRAAPGRWSVNADDADQYFARGDAVSRALKLTSELDFDAGHWGAFMRLSYFHDWVNDDRPELSARARDQAGEAFDILDAFVFADFELGQRAGNARLGRQVVSWGESTFIQGGLNVINPVDLSKLRVAGAELKEALLPVNMVAASLAFNERWSLDALYLLEFEQIEADPVGTYFSSNDFATPGGSYVMLGFGLAPQPVLNPDRYDAVCNHGAVSDNPDVAASPALRQAGCAAALARLPDQFARDDGQYGLALRAFVPEWNNTEFGAYFINYHSRVPLISGTAVTSTAANSARMLLEYPEDIRLYGVSFNTSLPSGLALQGEVSYRDNAPLQLDDVEVLFLALSPLNRLIAQPYNRFVSQLGEAQPGDYVRGYARHEVTQWQLTFTKVWGNVLGADQCVAVAEFGGTQVWDLPSPDVLRYQGDGTDTGGGPDVLNGAGRNPITQVAGFPTAYSWGYRTALRAEYNNAFNWPINLVPRLAFNHDVNGISPGPGGNFLEGRRSLTVGVEANYLNQWTLDLSYTRFSGARALNTVHDRDFAALSVRYAF